MWDRAEFQRRFRPPVIGMIHLQALPGAPAFADLGAVVDAAAGDLDALVQGGIRAVLVENFHDVPFWPDRVPPETVAAMAVVVAELRRRAGDVVVGVNVLRNDADAALALAAATGAAFVRINVHTGATVADQGLLAGRAHRTLRRRRELGLAHVGILADVRVKHAVPLGERDLADEARDLRLRGLADVIVASGPATGAATDPGQVRRLRDALPDCPLAVGSGVTRDNWSGFSGLADGCIVGTSLKTADRVDVERVRALVAAVGRGKDPA